MRAHLPYGDLSCFSLVAEEIETGKSSNASVIVKVYHGKGDGRRAWTDAPEDLLYGFRGSKHDVDLLSPFEMFVHWTPKRVVVPSVSDTDQTSEWTQ